MKNVLPLFRCRLCREGGRQSAVLTRGTAGRETRPLRAERLYRRTRWDGRQIADATGGSERPAALAEDGDGLAVAGDGVDVQALVADHEVHMDHGLVDA